MEEFSGGASRASKSNIYSQSFRKPKCERVRAEGPSFNFFFVKILENNFQLFCSYVFLESKSGPMLYLFSRSSGSSLTHLHRSSKVQKDISCSLYVDAIIIIIINNL